MKSTLCGGMESNRLQCTRFRILERAPHLSHVPESASKRLRAPREELCEILVRSTRSPDSIHASSDFSASISRIQLRVHNSKLSRKLHEMVASAPHTAEQLCAFLRSTPSSVSSTSDLQRALQAVRDLAPHSQRAYHEPVAIPNLDLDPFSPLLDQKSSGPSPSRNSTDTPRDSALTWLHTALPDSYKAAQVIEILESQRDDAEIQESLLNVWGFEGIEDLGEAVRRRSEIVEAVRRAADEPAERPDSTASNGGPSLSQLSAHARDYTPGAQLKFATQDEVQAMKQARKMMKKDKGKGRSDLDYGDEPDVEEWLRRREEDLARGPGALVSGKRVSISRFTCQCALCTSQSSPFFSFSFFALPNVQPAIQEEEQYPNVYLASKTTGLNIGTSKMSLPIGTLRMHKEVRDTLVRPVICWLTCQVDGVALRRDCDPGAKGCSFPFQRVSGADQRHESLGKTNVSRECPSRASLVASLLTVHRV